MNSEVQPVKLFGIEIDSINSVLAFMDWEHMAVHKGLTFHLSIYSTVTAGVPKYCEFRTGAKYIHLKQKNHRDGSDSTLCSFIEAPVIGTPGTLEVPSYNRNRNSNTVSSMKVYSNPNSITGGTILDYDYLFASTTNQSASSAVPSEDRFEWVLKPNTSYIFKLENLGDGDATFVAKLNWYEH